MVQKRGLVQLRAGAQGKATRLASTKQLALARSRQPLFTNQGHAKQVPGLWHFVLRPSFFQFLERPPYAGLLWAVGSLPARISTRQLCKERCYRPIRFTFSHAAVHSQNCCQVGRLHSTNLPSATLLSNQFTWTQPAAKQMVSAPPWMFGGVSAPGWPGAADQTNPNPSLSQVMPTVLHRMDLYQVDIAVGLNLRVNVHAASCATFAIN